MAHFQSETLTKPTHFNFAQDVVDYWAEKSEDLQAMFWVSEDYKSERSLSYCHFKTQSHRIAVLLEQLGVKAGDVILMILPRIPEW
jgi:acyl-coenzyme A synthetase/AMP-(fatty) acid ligase